jgi:hypothetical protein
LRMQTAQHIPTDLPTPEQVRSALAVNAREKSLLVKLHTLTVRVKGAGAAAPDVHNSRRRRGLYATS